MKIIEWWNDGDDHKDISNPIKKMNIIRMMMEWWNDGDDNKDKSNPINSIWRSSQSNKMEIIEWWNDGGDHKDKSNK